MKDVSGIFQLPFIAESEKVLRRMIFQSQPNDFPTTAERNDVWLKDAGTSFSP
ncbi:hypothetical protein [Paraprevotella clara]